MAGLYWDITLLAKVGKDTATKTMRRQAILYSSSGLMFSENKNNKSSLIQKSSQNVFSAVGCLEHKVFDQPEI